MTLLSRLFGRSSASQPERLVASLYAAIVARARQPHWYVEGAVPDTIDGRFDMVALILSAVLLRLEAVGAVEDGVHLTETFVADMDGQLRQIGIGDLVVGKQVGKMMSALGGRLGAYRDALAPGGDLDAALRRNLYRGEPVSDPAVAHVAAHVRRFAEQLGAMDRDALLDLRQRD